jgi:hypothetical protein
VWLTAACQGKTLRVSDVLARHQQGRHTMACARRGRGLRDARHHSWVGVLGLLDESPAVPEALLAVVEGGTTSMSTTQWSPPDASSGR